MPFGCIVLGITALVCISLYVISQGMKLPPNLSRPLIEGQEARLIDSGRAVLFCRDLRTYEQVARLDTENASDLAQLHHLTETEATALLASGTQVRVLQAHMRYYQVQILDGKYAGSTGYIPAEFVQE
jgi:hypothetical protein